MGRGSPGRRRARNGAGRRADRTIYNLCSAPVCRRVSKAASQRRWLAKSANLFSERIALWGLAGAGSGSLTLRPDGRPIETDVSMRTGAVGITGEVLDGSGPSGVGLSVRSDAMWVETKTDRTEGMMESAGEVSRLRLILEGQRAFAVGEGRRHRTRRRWGDGTSGGVTIDGFCNGTI